MRLTYALATGFVAATIAMPTLAGPIDDAMNADRAFARMAQDKSFAEAFGAYAAPDAMRFSPGAPERGPAAIRAAVARDFAEGGKLDWEPKEGSASADGSQVVVWGRWTLTAAKDPKGVGIKIHGTTLDRVEETRRRQLEVDP